MVRQKRVQHYQKLLTELKDESKSVKQRWKIVNQLTGEAGFGDDIEEFIAAGGVEVLVRIAVDKWPAKGRLAKSSCVNDKVANIAAAEELDRAAEVWTTDESYPRSIRRGVIGMLAEMGNYRPHVVEMERAGLFKPEALPQMVEDTLAQADFKLHLKGCEYEHVPDQTQAIVVMLINIAANAIRFSDSLAEYMAEHTAIKISQMYKDPNSVLVDEMAEERQRMERKAQMQRWRPEVLQSRMEALKDQQQDRKEDKKQDIDIQGGLGYYFVRFFNIMIMRCNEEQQLQLIHEGGLINKLKGCMDFTSPFMGGPHVTVQNLTEAWTKLCHKLSEDMYTRIKAEEAHSMELRQQGNATFKEGKLQEALGLYWQAVQHNPQEGALFNNIALCYIKTGQAEKALLSAEEAVKVDPGCTKTWCRLGDALKMIGRWQLAHLAYTMAVELSPRDPDVQARQQEARSHLEAVWDIDMDIPRPYADAGTPKWMKWLGVSQQQLMRAMRSTDNMTGPYSVVEGREGESRVYACFHMKAHVDEARAAAVAKAGTAAWLPPVCRHLKPPLQLPANPLQHWSVSWTDMPLRHKKTGLIRHCLSVADDRTGILKGNLMVLGTPGVNAVKQLLLNAIMNPTEGKPERPMGVFVAHRMFPIFCGIAEFCQEWGITAVAETAAEAQQSAKDNDTEWTGLNNSADATDGDYTSQVARTKRDPDNGQKQEEDSSSSAAAAAAAASSSSSRKKRDASTSKFAASVIAATSTGNDALASRDTSGAGASSSSSSSKQRGVRVGEARGVKVKKPVSGTRKS